MFHRAAEQVSGRELRPSEASRFWTGKALEWIRGDPAAWRRLTLRKLRLSLNVAEPWNIRSFTLSRDFAAVLQLPLLTFGVLGPLAFAGLVCSARDWRRLFPLYAMLGSIWAALILFFVISRYRLPAVPVLAIFAGFACVQAFDAIREERWRRLLVLAACTALAAVFVNIRAVGEDLSVAYYNLGNRYKVLEQWDLAIAAYGSAIARNPGYLSAHNNLAIVYEQTGEHDEEAVRTWQHILDTAERRNLERYVERATRHLRTLEEP
jgi:tetratricopeptide (TPR) repeat protein